jgi:uncharacterized membrane protein YedE/YeeE
MNITILILLFWCGCSLGALLTYRWMTRQAKPHEIQKFPKMWFITSCWVIGFAVITLIIPEKARFWYALGVYIFMVLAWSRRSARS